MMTGVLYAATLASALGCGLVAGVFFAFSTFVMPALKRLPPAHGIAVMQSINKVAGAFCDLGSKSFRALAQFTRQGACPTVQFQRQGCGALR